jgi:hypothetical protein
MSLVRVYKACQHVDSGIVVHVLENPSSYQVTEIGLTGLDCGLASIGKLTQRSSRA